MGVVQPATRQSVDGFTVREAYRDPRFEHLMRGGYT